MRVRPPTFSGVAIGAAVVLIVTATTATAAALITSADIKDNTVQSKDLKNNNIASGDIKDATITSADIKNNVVASADILNGTIAAADLNSAVADVLGLFGPVHLADRPDTGCATDDPGQAPWALSSMDRYFTVKPAEDGMGFMVTRYDMNGTFTTVTGGQHPGCEDAGLFVDATEDGVWQGIWTQKVTGNFDYRPESTMPADPTFANFITEFFTAPGGSADGDARQLRVRLLPAMRRPRLESLARPVLRRGDYLGREYRRLFVAVLVWSTTTDNGGPLTGASFLCATSWPSPPMWGRRSLDITKGNGASESGPAAGLNRESGHSHGFGRRRGRLWKTKSISS